MKYVSAKCLPDALVKQLQSYVRGGYIYVPADSGSPKRWGEVSGYRQELDARKERITREYRQGEALQSLARRYSLSVYAIRKIVYRK